VVVIANLKKGLIEVATFVVTVLYFWFFVFPQFALLLWSEIVCLAGVNVSFWLIFI
jgi:hypothetical protein